MHSPRSSASIPPSARLGSPKQNDGARLLQNTTTTCNLSQQYVLCAHPKATARLSSNFVHGALLWLLRVFCSRTESVIPPLKNGGFACVQAVQIVQAHSTPSLMARMALSRCRVRQAASFQRNGERDHRNSLTKSLCFHDFFLTPLNPLLQVARCRWPESK